MISESVICAIISAAGVVLSALVSADVSKRTTQSQIDLEIIKQNAELKKENMEWQHLFEQENRKSISEIITLVSEILRLRKSGVSGDMYREAIGKINFLRVREKGRMKTLLDILYYDIETCQEKALWDECKIKATLASIVDEQRKQENKYCRHDTSSTIN